MSVIRHNETLFTTIHSDVAHANTPLLEIRPSKVSIYIQHKRPHSLTNGQEQKQKDLILCCIYSEKSHATVSFLEISPLEPFRRLASQTQFH